MRSEMKEKSGDVQREVSGGGAFPPGRTLEPQSSFHPPSHPQARFGKPSAHTHTHTRACMYVKDFHLPVISGLPLGIKHKIIVRHAFYGYNRSTFLKK